MRGRGLPVWDSQVADLAKIAPDAEAATFARAAADPVRGPEALYTHVVKGMPANVVSKEISLMVFK